jgi:hypothetical protein
VWNLDAWLELRDPAAGSGEPDAVAAVVRELAAWFGWDDLFNIRIHGELLRDRHVLTAAALTNHRDSRTELWDELLGEVVRRLPGSYGLVYERDDETDDPPGRNAFRVRVVAGGTVEERPDPFLSPAVPVVDTESVEDLPAVIPVPGGPPPPGDATPAGAEGEVHAWLRLWDSVDDDPPDDPAGEPSWDRDRRRLHALQAAADREPSPGLRIRYDSLNGGLRLTATLHGPLDGAAAAFLESRLTATLATFPASYGLVHERAWGGPFAVRAVARGRVHRRGDPFLSP